MSKQYFVTCVETVECETCEGTGWVMHPAWARYWKENGDKVNMMSAEDDLEWFRANEDPFARKYSDLPSEEVVCHDCEGEATRTYQVDLLTALHDLGAFRNSFEKEVRGTVRENTLAPATAGDLPSAAVGFTGDKTDERRFDHDCG